MRKFKFFVDETKEEQWINEMCAQGWHFEHYNPLLLKFTFKKGEPEAYTYRIDSIFKRDNDYFDFVESTGAELVYKNIYWAYFRKPKVEGNFELYSDYSSRLNYLNRLMTMYVFIMLLNMISIFYNSVVLKDFIKSSIWLTDAIIGLNALCMIIVIALIGKTIKRKRKIKEQLSMY